MGSDYGWDAEEIFKKYLHDYMVKKNMHKTAHIFAKEAKADICPVAIDSPQGFLAEWWSIFHDMYFHVQPGFEQTTEKVMNKGKEVIGTPLHNAYSETSNSGITVQGVESPVGSAVNSMFQQPDHRKHKRVNRKRLNDEVDTHSLAGSTITQTGARLSGGSDRNPERNLPKQAQRQQEKKQTEYSGTASVISSLYAESKPIGTESALEGTPLRGWPLIGANQSRLHVGNQLPNSSMQFGSNPPQMEIPAIQFQHQTMDTLGYFSHLLAAATTKSVSPFPFSSDLDSLLEERIETYDKNSGKEEGRVPDENVEMFFSPYNGHAECIQAPSISQQLSTSVGKEHTGVHISLVEVGSLHASKSKVFSCDFSPDGKLLAYAGHDRKAFIWNMDTLGYTSTSESHAHLVSDIRFHPSSEIFATSSFDRTVRLWDAAGPGLSLFTLVGHNDHVMSLDFHPRKMDLICSCDSNDEIRMWNFKESTCLRVSKGAIRQVRFQPGLGKLLAAAAGNGVNIFDVETGNFLFDLVGHDSQIRSLSWDVTGEYIASVSEESVRLWSTATGGKCIHELNSRGSSFHSCTFHPDHSLLLVIGSYQFLNLWNPTQSSTVDAIAAHRGHIASMAGSSSKGLIASASHDQCVKLWK